MNCEAGCECYRVAELTCWRARSAAALRRASVLSLKGLGFALVASELGLRILPPPWRVLRFSIIEY